MWIQLWFHLLWTFFRAVFFHDRVFLSLYKRNMISRLRTSILQICSKGYLGLPISPSWATPRILCRTHPWKFAHRTVLGINLRYPTCPLLRGYQSISWYYTQRIYFLVSATTSWTSHHRVACVSEDTETWEERLLQQVPSLVSECKNSNMFIVFYRFIFLNYIYKHMRLCIQ